MVRFDGHVPFGCLLYVNKNLSLSLSLLDRWDVMTLSAQNGNAFNKIVEYITFSENAQFEKVDRQRRRQKQRALQENDEINTHNRILHDIILHNM